MSASISMRMKDGTKREFHHRGRPGGSYTIQLKLEGGFAVVIDEYGSRTCIPASDILDIEETPLR